MDWWTGLVCEGEGAMVLLMTAAVTGVLACCSKALSLATNPD